MITPGYAIVRAAGASPVIESVGGVDGRIATGLTRPDVYNWFDEIRAQVKELRPRAVVLAFGGNDDKSYMTGVPEGVSIGDFGGSSWRREYARRVGGVMDVINKAGGFVIWIGLPQTQSSDQTRRFDVVNAVAQKEARKREGKRGVHRHVHDVRGRRRRLRGVPAGRLGRAPEGPGGRRRPLRARGRRHHRARGAAES